MQLKIFVITLGLSAVLCAPLITDDIVEQVADHSLTIPQGTLVGTKSGILNRYYTFKGIPYAEPPVGPLRFRSPRPHRGWSGVLDAREHRSVCPQMKQNGGSGAFGDEDCLFLNVYTPDPNRIRNYPVMVFVHGGAFRSGSGNEFYYAPDHLVDENAILVTINYRLGLLGFFSTGDGNAQGNYGIKDIIAALQWVQESIVYFGGDKNKVTLFGESSGSVLVNALVLSTASQGLINRAISQSGTLIAPWAFQPDPQKIAFKVAKVMGLSGTTTEAIANELRSIPDALQLVWDDNDNNALPRGQHPLDFVPCVERNSTEQPAIIDTALESLKKGQWPQIPYIIGTNSHEALYLIREVLLDRKLFQKFADNPSLLIPPAWNYTAENPESDEIVEEIQDMYFHGETVKEKLDYVDYQTDAQYHYPAYKTVELMMAHQKNAPIYYYVFGHTGALNLGKHLLLLDSYDGAMHTDDLAYIFRMGGVPNPVIPGSPTDKVRKRMVKMWTDFAKGGNPTPEITSLITTKWEPTQSNKEYMLIDKELTFTAQPFQKRMELWKRLDQTYGFGYD